jgi:hypothetical protein
MTHSRGGKVRPPKLSFMASPVRGTVVRVSLFGDQAVKAGYPGGDIT